MPGPKAKFLFSMCNDVKAMQCFYSGLLGCDHTWKSDTYLNFDAGIQIIFFQWDTPTLPVDKEWAWQPGYKAACGDSTSWNLEYEDFATFRAVVNRLRDAGSSTFQPNPEWRRDCYWGHAVKDPMGNTVELSFLPTVAGQTLKPDSLTWVD